MTTTFYLHAANTTVSGTLPTTAQGGASPRNFTSGSDAQTKQRSMDTNIGSSQVSISVATLATTSSESYYFGKWISPPLNVTSVDSNTWTINEAWEESISLAELNIGVAIFIYVWRPSTGSFVGWIADGVNASGFQNINASATEKSFSGTFSGSAVTCQVGDVIVLERWTRVSQGSATAYTDTYFFDGGTVNINANDTTVSDIATYIQTPQSLLTQTYSYSLTDTVTISDSLTGKLKRRNTMTESATITEARQKKAVYSRTDTLSMVESEAKIRRVPRIQADTLSFGADVIRKLVNHVLTQSTGSITDSMKKQAVHMLADTPPLVDAIKKKATHKMSEAIGSVTDSLGRFKKGIKTFTDSSPISVSFEKKKNSSPQLGLDDQMPILDAVTKHSNMKAFAESLGTITQQTRPTKGRALSQGVGAITDSMKKKATHVLSDTFGVSEIFQKMHLGRPHLTESVGAISDSMQKHHRFLRGLVQTVKTVISGTGNT